MIRIFCIYVTIAVKIQNAVIDVLFPAFEVSVHQDNIFIIDSFIAVQIAEHPGINRSRVYFFPFFQKIQNTVIVLILIQSRQVIRFCRCDVIRIFRVRRVDKMIDIINNRRSL